MTNSKVSNCSGPGTGLVPRYCSASMGSSWTPPRDDGDADKNRARHGH
nr:hypothetical protein [Candidatus Sigynarchaeum springense]